MERSAEFSTEISRKEQMRMSVTKQNIKTNDDLTLDLDVNVKANHPTHIHHTHTNTRVFVTSPDQWGGGQWI